MNKKEELNLWKDRIKKSIDYRKKYVSDWNYWEQIYDNNLWATNRFGARSKMPNPNSPVQVNELDTIVNTIIPKILYSYPIFDVEDMASGNTLAALVYEIYALKLYEMLEMYNTLREVAMDTLLLGVGIHKTGMMYDLETSEYHNKVSIFNEMPMSCYVQPQNFLWDYRFDDWGQARWFAEEIEKPLEEVKQSDLYSNTKNLKGNTSSIDYLPKEYSKNYRNVDDIVRIIEIHDLVGGKIITISLNHEEFLQYDNDYGICIYDNLEFSKTRPKRMFGKSISQEIEQHLVRLSLNNHWMDEDGKSAARRMYMVDNSIGKQAVQRIDSDDPRVLVPIDGLMGMSADPVREIRTSNNVFQWSTTIGIIEREIRQLAGSTAADRGIHEAGVETAVEANMLQQASETRNKDRAMLLSIFIQKVMGKMLLLSSSYMRPERIAELIGMPAQDAFLIEPFDNMKLTVKYGSTAIESREVYKQKLIQIAQMFPDLVNRHGLMQKFMSTLGFGIKDQDLFIGDAARPQEQQAQQPQPELMQGGA